MVFTNESALDPIKICVDSLRVLVEAIRNSQQDGKRPLIVSISRRMPHILFWFRHTFATEDEIRILDNTEIITEIALPFIDFKKADQDIEIFLVDDMIVTGKTFSYVSDLIRNMAKSAPLRSYTVFCDKYSRFLYNHRDQLIVGYQYNNDSQKKEILNFISSVIAVTLPIDVTYPILYLVNHDKVGYLDSDLYWFKEPKGKEVDNYSTKATCKIKLKVCDQEINVGSVNLVYTSLLPSSISNSINNDFAKIRRYERLGKTIIVPYAPNILSDSNLKDRDLFEAPEYKAIWGKALSGIDEEYIKDYDLFEEDSQYKELVKNRTFRSLVSVANYLYSLSTFNKLLKSKKEEEEISEDQVLPSFEIKKEDLQLIVGSKLANVIMPLLAEIIKKNIVSPRQHKKIEVNTTFIPWVFEHDYDLSKYLNIQSGKSEVGENLNAIFRNAVDKQDTYPILTDDDVEFGVEGIMESFASLQNALNATTHEKQVEINQWVDEQIDNAIIVSRYANVTDSNHEHYWRRFFRLSSSFIE